MKIIIATTPWNMEKLTATLQQKLNPLFQKARQTDITFNIVNDGDAIIIDQPAMYEGYLFKITANGRELHVAKSEHYVDDVNLLTLLSIIETLQMEMREGEDIVYISGE